MEMVPKEFIDLAHELSHKFKTEAAFRSAISRSYYGLYNLMSRFLVSNDILLRRTAEDHNLIHKYLHNCGVQDVQRLANILNDLRVERNGADYRLELTQYNDPNLARMTYLKANTAYNGFEKLISKSRNRKNIIKGVLVHKNKTQT